MIDHFRKVLDAFKGGDYKAALSAVAGLIQFIAGQPDQPTPAAAQGKGKKAQPVNAMQVMEQAVAAGDTPENAQAGLLGGIDWKPFLASLLQELMSKFLKS